jgi:hypothetical protein
MPIEMLVKDSYRAFTYSTVGQDKHGARLREKRNIRTMERCTDKKKFAIFGHK